VEIDREIFTKIAEYKKNNRAIIAVGTTVCRTLESLPYLWKKLSKDEQEKFSENTRYFWQMTTEKLCMHDYVHSPNMNFEF